MRVKGKEKMAIIKDSKRKAFLQKYIVTHEQAISPVI